MVTTMSRRRATALLALLLCLRFGPPAGAQEIANPPLFEKSLEAARQALDFYGAYDNRAEMRRVADLGYRLARESGFTKVPFTFFLIEMPIPNAFALPGGQIFITRGMLDLGLSDEMLAALLGHEIGHVVREHGLRLQKKATLLNALSQALLIGVAITADSGRDRGPVPSGGIRTHPGDRPGTSVVLGAAAAGAVVSELLMRSYSREFEDEADDEGQRMAAGAGFDPDGARQLMALMEERLPQTREYGYWQTHPFFDQRVRAATVRGELLTVKEPQPAHAYRQETQRVLLAFRDQKPVTPVSPTPADRSGRPPRSATPPPAVERSADEPPRPDLLQMAALTAWPIGPTAERLRLLNLHARRDWELGKHEFARDFGALVALYEEELAEVAELEVDAPLLAELEREIRGFHAAAEALYPRAAAILEGGVYQTGFLEVFESNYPEAPGADQVALELGRAYSALGRPEDAVPQYLRAWRADPEGEAGRSAARGLRNLAPVLADLRALQELADQPDDPELAHLAGQRLAKLAGSYEKMTNGARYLKKYPNGEHAAPVTARLNALADNVYGEVVLYQTVGEHAKALDGIHRILSQAPLSPAAEKLRSRVVVES